jgi:subtilisin family serine protease
VALATTAANSQQTTYQISSPAKSELVNFLSHPPDSTQEWIVVFSAHIPNKQALASVFEHDLKLAIASYYGPSKLTDTWIKPLQLINGAAFSAPARILPSLLGHSYISYIDHNYEVRINPTLRIEASTQMQPKRVANLNELTGQGVIIAIIDTGVDYTHPDLGGCFGVQCRVIGGYDIIDDDPDPFDENGHGTHVAGIAAGTGASSGVAQGAKILAYRALNAIGSGTMASTIEAIERAVQDGAHIINMSLGATGVPPNNPLNLAVREAVKQGVLVVASAGNSGPHWGTISSPGSEELTLTVGALDANSTVARFSSRGPVRSSFTMKPDISAPGVNILSAALGGGHIRLSGTSMAAPYVAGLAALTKELMPQADVLAIRSRIIQSSNTLSQPFWHTGMGLANTDITSYSQIAAHPTSIGTKVGEIEVGGGLQTLDETLSIWNFSNVARSASITIDAPVGVSIIAQSNSIVPASGKIELPIRIQIDPGMVAFPAETPPIYLGSIQLVFAESDTVIIPIIVARPSQIEFEFQSPPSLVVIHDQKGGFDFRGNPGRTFSIETGAGMYDIWAIRDADATKWIIEGVIVEGATKRIVLDSDAKNTLRYELTDPNGNFVGACGYSREFLRHKSSNLGLTYQYERSCPEVPALVIQHQISTISSNVLYEVSHVAYGAPTKYEYLRFPFRFEGGIDGNMLMRKGGVEFKPVNWRYMMPSGVTKASFIRFYETTGGNTFNPPSWLRFLMENPWNRTEHLIANPRADFAPFRGQYDNIYTMEANQFDPEEDAAILITPSVHLTLTDSLVLKLPDVPASREWMIPYSGEQLVLGAGPDSWSAGSMALTDTEINIPTSNTWLLGWNREMRVGQLQLEIVDPNLRTILDRTVKNGIPKIGSIHSDDWITQSISGDGYRLNLTRTDTWLRNRQQITTITVPLHKAAIDAAQNCIDRLAILDAFGNPIQVAELSSDASIVIESRSCDLSPVVTIHHWTSQEAFTLTSTVSNRGNTRVVQYALPDGLAAGYFDVSVGIGGINETIFEQLISPALLITNGEHILDPPMSPKLLSPSSRQFVFDERIELAWESTDTVHNYRVQLALDGDFTKIVTDSLVNSSPLWLPVYGYGQIWYWRVSAMNGEGWGPWSPRRSFTSVIEATALEDDVLPHEWVLHQNYPNPFNPATTISFGIGATEPVRVDVFSVTGQRIKSIDLGMLSPGRHSIIIDMSGMSSGLYLYQISTPSFRQARKMTLVK